MGCNKDLDSAVKFSLLDKLVMSIGFHGVVLIGLYAVYRESAVWGLIYLGFLIFGFLILFGYCLCAHCPHPYHHSDCLFPPFGKLYTKIFRFRPEPLSFSDKIGFYIIMIGLVIIPQYWLCKNYLLLALFWIFCLPTFLGLLLHQCKKCMNTACPFNSAGRIGKV